ncbi:SecDF P1 head subdomain-containing protein [Kribbella sp. C-35]|uniref:SecDF P1 head subdomain-containing protein n=1 Tax=Kribbella sp. C-35 TaxID=2789276 RepID=UPI003979DF67
MTQPPVPPNQPPGPQGQPYPQDRPPVPPGQPPFPPYAPIPPKRSKGPLLIVGGLVLLLVVLTVTGLVLIMNHGGDEPVGDESPPPARTKPSDPKAVEFRRVLTSKPGKCPTPSPSGTACDDQGNVYTLGKVELDGSNVSEVKAGYDPAMGTSWYVNLNLDPEGTKLFGQLTASIAKQEPPANLLAIVVHGEVAAAPAVQSAITGGQVQISGGYTRDTAEALAKKITG